MYEDGTMDPTERKVAELLQRYENIIRDGNGVPHDSEYQVWQELVALVKEGNEDE